MQKNDNDMIIAEGKDLFNRVVSIFEQARVNAYQRFATLEVANSTIKKKATLKVEFYRIY